MDAGPPMVTLCHQARRPTDDGPGIYLNRSTPIARTLPPVATPPVATPPVANPSSLTRTSTPSKPSADSDANAHAESVDQAIADGRGASTGGNAAGPDGSSLRLPSVSARPSKPATLALPTVRLGGVALHAVSEEKAIETILTELESGRGGTVITPNLDHLKRCGSDLTFRALVEESDLVVADGMPLVWASRVQGTPLPERVAGSNLISSLSEAAALSGRRVFLLGGDPGQAVGAAKVLSDRHPELCLAGAYCPPYGFEYDNTEIARIVEALVSSKPDIIFVALGSPKQEKLISQIRHTLPQAWWLGVGISFSFLTGHVRRAPDWMQRTGLEWIHRLGQEPKRLFKRYVVHGIPFFAHMVASAASYRIRRRLRMLPQDKVKRIVEPRIPKAKPTATPAVDGDQVSKRLDGQLQLDADANARAVEEAMKLKPATTQTNLDAEPNPVAHDHLRRLRALVLLGGRVRPSSFTNCVQRPALELPLTDDMRLLDGWIREAEGVAKFASLEWLPLQIVVSDEHDVPEFSGPDHVPDRPPGAFSVMRDMSAFRGTGGVLHDLAGEYDDEDLLLVCSAGQILMDPLSVQVRALSQKIARGADMAIIGHEDGTPGGAMLLRCKTLRGISSIGYVDMKEQALPKIAEKFTVRVVRTRMATALPTRSQSAYLDAVGRYHAHAAGRGRGTEPGPMDEQFDRNFSIVEPGAKVDSSAYLHDSVVLQGATVEAGATLVRCIVCEGGHVKAGRRLVDELIMPAA